ncbi:predicted protein [Pyrenophora tritici-repentis Pt-1C-BFP]|uniref:Uncharacterized protein n=1 Tax=Pyrenophora tritici-repentis (strain Pt-1C-BFP) TaxID=426418 RepID=B2VTF2_PYRTR|nr:uncharacterized protein PTRG_01916 [Pyrenophora tritici-repentis Pt-1C-BFP]EDU41354.1 predicted protein [Pyrenophora tritici-repentis Pt-1C-BFP]
MSTARLFLHLQRLGCPLRTNFCFRYAFRESGVKCIGVGVVLSRKKIIVRF